MRREVILKEVKKIAGKHLFSLDTAVYLFGSWARGEERVTSDIDLAVWYEKTLPVGTLSKLRLAFEESNIPYRVEIVDLSRTDRKFRNKIMSTEEGIAWTKSG